MPRYITSRKSVGLLAAAAVLAVSGVGRAETELDKRLAADNVERKVDVAPKIDDLTFLRRASIDLIGRIPTLDEVKQYGAWPRAERRQRLVDKLLADEGFGDRWTVFVADMLRIRANTDGGAAMLAFVHDAVQEGMPYDVLCRQLISATGKAGKIPQAGFVLGDNADPMALTAATAQVFMGVRIACAQCHDHPFDVWTREQFYGLAAYFGKTGSRERKINNAVLGVYVIEKPETAVKWPPEGLAPEKERKALDPKFPFNLEPESPLPKHVMRLVSLRKSLDEQQKQKVAARNASLDDLLAAADKVPANKSKDSDPGDVANASATEARALKVENDLYPASELRLKLAELVTNPRNRYFSRLFVNRAWASLMARGFVEPCDDFNDKNPPSHTKTLDYLADEFVAGGYDLRSVVKQIVLSDAYQRGQLPDLDDSRRAAAETAFTAAPVRRMMAEAIFDSVVTAGHLFSIKHAPGDNMKTIREIVQVPVELGAKTSAVGGLTPASEKPSGGAGMGAMAVATPKAAGGGYDLESAIEINFKDVLTKARLEKEPQVAEMDAPEDLESQKGMMARAARRKYVDKVVETTIDDNPKYTSSMRMPSPAQPAHFLRIFGQPARDLLGDHRDHSPSMRQALMMLNGKLTHEASRVGKAEPIYELLAGERKDLSAAIVLAYREILTRNPSADEAQEAESMLREAASPLDGMADLRWILFNSHEFRFVP